MGCTASNFRHEIGEPVVVKPLESNYHLDTRSPYSVKAAEIAGEPRSGSCDSSNNIPIRELFPPTSLDIASAPNFDMSGFVMELNPRRFSLRDPTTVELLHCLNIVKSWIAIPGMLCVKYVCLRIASSQRYCHSEGLTLTGTERGPVDYATWCSRHLEDCGLPASQPQNVSNMVAGKRFRRPTEGCTSYRRKY